MKISEEEFAETGESPTLKNELNLDDMLFTYGVRINPVTVQDITVLRFVWLLRRLVQRRLILLCRGISLRYWNPYTTVQLPGTFHL